VTTEGAPNPPRFFMIVLVSAILGPFLFALVAAFWQLPPATIVIRHTVRSDGRYPVYMTSVLTFVLLEVFLMLALLPALVVKRAWLQIRRKR
jgi:hypothetical protein